MNDKTFTDELTVSKLTILTIILLRHHLGQGPMRVGQVYEMTASDNSDLSLRRDFHTGMDRCYH